MKTKLTFAALSLIAVPAFAMGAGAGDVDANGDGVLTIDEVQAVYPEVSTDAFTAMDLDASGTLDESEVAAAQEAGMMPASDG
ncbi:MAG: hypothetical protein AAGM84_18815 [Pseudomonadota bacterium]